MLLLAIAIAGGYLVVAWKLEQISQGIEAQHRSLRKFAAEADERISKRLHDLTYVIERIDDRSFAIHSAVAPLEAEIQGEAAAEMRRVVDQDRRGRAQYFTDEVLPRKG
jgi:hypothetical protein